MLLVEREETILALVNQHGVVSVRELAKVCDVTEVTIRRDLNKLEARNLLRRTHGGAMRLDKKLLEKPDEPDCGYVSPANGYDIPDALILAPVRNSAIHTLRERALRNSIPLLAESCPFPGAIYLGPDNYEAGFELGVWTGTYVQEHRNGEAHVLNISQGDLPNTRQRSRGFIDGLQSVLGTNVPVLTVEGRGLFSDAYQVAFDALRTQPAIDVIFGINDDSVLGGLQAYLDQECDPDRLLAVNVGGEGKTLFDRLDQDSPLKACMALFPEVVGRMGVEAILHLWAGEDISSEIITPSALVTATTLSDYYTPRAHGWEINFDALSSLKQTRWEQPTAAMPGKRMSFVIHYCTHEWYQNLAKAMHVQADKHDVDLSVVDVKDNLQAEIQELRRLIGKLAATYVQDGDTIILDSGTPTTYMAQFLQRYRNLTVITNSLPVFQVLQNVPAIHVTLIGGEFQRESQAFVGRAGKLLLQEIRADKAFVVAGGVTSAFGISSKNLTEAEMRRAMIDAAHEVVVLADHTVLGFDAHARVTELDRIDTLITDAGALSEHRLDLNRRGIKVMVAGQLNGAGHQD